MPKPKITVNNIFENPRYMEILRVLYIYETGLEVDHLVYIFLGEEKLLKLKELGKAYLSKKTIKGIEFDLEQKGEDYRSVKLKNKINNISLLYQRLGKLNDLGFIEKKDSKYKLTKTARDILIIKHDMSVLLDSSNYKKTIISDSGKINIYTNQEFVEKYNNSEEVKKEIDRVIKDMNKSFKELRELIFKNHKEERKSTIDYYRRLLNELKSILRENSEKEKKLEHDIKDIENNIEQHKELMEAEPRTIVVMKPYDMPSTRDFFKLILEKDLDVKLSDMYVFSRRDIE